MDTVEKRLNMAEPRRKHEITGKTMLFAAVAAVTIAGPILVLMAVILSATIALFLVSAPLMLIFSPVLLGAGFVFLAALAGFGFATVMAMAGLAAFGWVLRSVRGDVDGRERRKLLESGEMVKDAGNSLVDQLKQVRNMPESRAAAGAY